MHSIYWRIESEVIGDIQSDPISSMDDEGK